MLIFLHYKSKLLAISRRSNWAKQKYTNNQRYFVSKINENISLSHLFSLEIRPNTKHYMRERAGTHDCKKEEKTNHKDHCNYCYHKIIQHNHRHSSSAIAIRNCSVNNRFLSVFFVLQSSFRSQCKFSTRLKCGIGLCFQWHIRWIFTKRIKWNF